MDHSNILQEITAKAHQHNIARDGPVIDLSIADQLRFARAVGGESYETYVRKVYADEVPNVCYDPIGVPCTRDAKDVRVARLSDKYKIVYWGGDGAEVAKLWSYKLYLFRGTLTFDADIDHPIDMRAAGIRVTEWFDCKNIVHTPEATIAREGIRLTFTDGKGLNREVMFPERPVYIPPHVLVLL
ncbi:hypothetical protein DFH06DRAFT_312897 [Mycena polygramma]|nr:hypothetical protein DFH06DRAFT_312897 [Mycena polygramma]